MIDVVRGFDRRYIKDSRVAEEAERVWREEDVPDVYRVDHAILVDLQFLDYRILCVRTAKDLVIFYTGDPPFLEWLERYLDRVKDHDDLLFHVIHSVLEDVNERILSEHRTLSRIENKIIGGYGGEEDIRNLYSHMAKLLEIKRNLTYFNQVLPKLSDVLDEYQISELRSSISEGLTLIDLSLGVARSIMDVYDKTLSMELNLLIKRLTAISIILAVLTIITGMWGMNFANIPLYDHPLGFWIITGFMVLLFLLLTALFKTAGWM